MIRLYLAAVASREVGHRFLLAAHETASILSRSRAPPNTAGRPERKETRESARKTS